MLVALHHAPPGFPCVFDAREISLYLVWRNATTRTSPKYNNSFMERWYIGNGWTYKFEGKKCLIFGEKIPVFIILVVKKKINRPLFSYGSKYRWRYLLITMYSPKYSDVCFCVFLSSVRWGGLGANFDSERMSPTSRPSLSFW